MSHLFEAAERTLGHDADNKLIRQCAYANANLACNVVFHSKKSDKDLNEMIHLCCDVDMFTHKCLRESILLWVQLSSLSWQSAQLLSKPGHRKSVLNVASLDTFHDSVHCAFT